MAKIASYGFMAKWPHKTKWANVPEKSRLNLNWIFSKIIQFFVLVKGKKIPKEEMYLRYFSYLVHPVRTSYIAKKNWSLINSHEWVLSICKSTLEKFFSTILCFLFACLSKMNCLCRNATWLAANYSLKLAALETLCHELYQQNDLLVFWQNQLDSIPPHIISVNHHLSFSLI